MDKNHVKGILSAVFATMFMGSLGVFVKDLPISPIVITFFRLFVAAVLIFFTILMQGNIKELKKMPSKELFLSGFSLSASIVFYIIAIQKTSMSNAVFLLYLGPIFASLIAFIFLGESLKGIDILSLFMALTGILFVLKFKFNIEKEELDGIVYGVAAGIFYGMLIVSNRMIKQNVHLLISGFYQFVIGSLILLPMCIGLFKVDIILENIKVLLAVGFINGFLGITLMFNAIKNLKSVEYGIFSYLEVVYAVLFGVIFFSETLDIFKIIGGIFILSAGLLQVLKSRNTNYAREFSKK